MKSLLQFFIKRGTFLFFLLLEVLSLMLVFNFSDFHRSAFFTFSNTVCGRIYKTVASIENFFSLSAQNELLNAENASLRQYILTLEQELGDSTAQHAIAVGRQYNVYSAQVIHLTTDRKNNFILLDKGIADGVNKNMAVINKDGLVGIVTNSNEHYSVCLPIINSDLKVNCRIQNTGYVGMVAWDGVDCSSAHMYDVATHIKVSKGDTIVTSGMSSVFPPNLPVGVVVKADAGDANVYYDIDIRLFADFKKLNYVSVISNLNLPEEEEIQRLYMQ